MYRVGVVFVVHILSYWNNANNAIFTGKISNSYATILQYCSSQFYLSMVAYSTIAPLISNINRDFADRCFEFGFSNTTAEGPNVPTVVKT